MPAPQPPVPAAPTKEATPTPAPPAKPPAIQEAKPSAPPPSPAKAPAKKEEAMPVAPVKAPPAKMEAKAPTQGGTAGATVKYSLQIGAMVMQQNAEALKQKLDASGFPATVRKGTASVKRQTVTAGEPTSKPEAEELARRLTVDGFPSQLITVGSKYTPQVGAFFDENEAIDLARELQKKYYSPKITVKPAKTTVFQVRHGRFDSRAAATKRGEELKKKGFPFMVVQN
jgi:cell division protein FtsN